MLRTRPIFFACILLASAITFASPEADPLLLRSPEVRADLGLTASQKAALRRLFSESHELFLHKRQMEAQGKLQTSLRLLTPAQRKRLEQIEAQRNEGFLLLYPKASQAVGLTSAQAKQFKARWRKEADKFQSAQRQAGPEKANKLRNAYRERCAAIAREILSPSQRQKLSRFLGKPIKKDIHFDIDL